MSTSVQALEINGGPPPPPSSPPSGSQALLEGQVPGDSELPNSSDDITEEEGGEGEKKKEGQEEEEEEEEETECGFCLFMKGGGCKDEFIAWEKCVEEADRTTEDIVDKCFEVTALLKKCMDAHADYYHPILAAEQSMAEAAEQSMAEEAATASLDSEK